MKHATRHVRWICLVMALAIVFTSGFTFSSGGSSKSPFADVKKGDIVTFGTYEQDDLTRNGAEPIEWIVLAVEGDQALLLSRCVLRALVWSLVLRRRAEPEYSPAVRAPWGPRAPPS